MKKTNIKFTIGAVRGRDDDAKSTQRRRTNERTNEQTNQSTQGNSNKHNLLIPLIRLRARRRSSC